MLRVAEQVDCSKMAAGTDVPLYWSAAWTRLVDHIQNSIWFITAVCRRLVSVSTTKLVFRIILPCFIKSTRGREVAWWRLTLRSHNAAFGQSASAARREGQAASPTLAPLSAPRTETTMAVPASVPSWPLEVQPHPPSAPQSVSTF